MIAYLWSGASYCRVLPTATRSTAKHAPEEDDLRWITKSRHLPTRHGDIPDPLPCETFLRQIRHDFKRSVRKFLQRQFNAPCKETFFRGSHRNMSRQQGLSFLSHSPGWKRLHSAFDVYYAAGWLTYRGKLVRCARRLAPACRSIDRLSFSSQTTASRAALRISPAAVRCTTSMVWARIRDNFFSAGLQNWTRDLLFTPSVTPLLENSRRSEFVANIGTSTISDDLDFESNARHCFPHAFFSCWNRLLYSTWHQFLQAFQEEKRRVLTLAIYWSSIWGFFLK